MYGFSKTEILNMNIFPQLSYHLTLCKPFIYGYKSFTIEQKCIRAHNF